MRKRMDEATAERPSCNFSLIATPAEGLSGRFVRIDRKKYGMIAGRYRPRLLHQLLPYPGLLSRSPRLRRSALEAPYHALTNGGHITYIELDGDPTARTSTRLKRWSAA